MTGIKAPYNFVPLNEKVFLPHWGHAISHDVPFKNGLSGQLTLKITAESPIFIRGGGQESTAGPGALEFANMNGRYYIPGSSIKGMLRNVVEIMGFGKFSQFNDDLYGFRDIKSKDYPLKGNLKAVRMGWLRKTVESNLPYEIFDVGQIIHGNNGESNYKISHTELTNRHPDKPDFTSIFSNNGINADYSEHYPRVDVKTSEFKYKLFYGGNDITSEHLFKKGDHQVNVNDDRDHFYVFTGQINPNDTESGKKHEFLFPALQSDNQDSYKITEDQFKNFCFIYKDHDKENISADWRFLKRRLYAGKEIPVFFCFEKNKKSIAHFGLSFLYKIPYAYSIGQLVNRGQSEYKLQVPDLAECLFGLSRGNGVGLKGRIHIAHAFAPGHIDAMDEVSMVLMSPKASYYPNYIQQSVGKDGLLKTNRYNTLMSKNASIRGYKRYPQSNSINDNQQVLQDSLVTNFTPLPAGTTFETILTYHNLREEELGALLSALTFHNTDVCRHSIGMAKSMGYGRIIITIDEGGQLFSEQKLTKYLGCFETTMNKFLNQKWHQTKQITELISMATPIENRFRSYLEHMELTDFAQIKNNPKMALPPFSEWQYGNRASCQSILSDHKVPEDTELYTRNRSKLIEELLLETINSQITVAHKKIAILQKEEDELKKEILKAEVIKRKEKESEEREKKLETALEGGLGIIRQADNLKDLMHKMKTWIVAYHWKDTGKKESYDAVKVQRRGHFIPEGLITDFKQVVHKMYHQEAGSGKINKRRQKDYRANLELWIGPKETGDFFDNSINQTKL